MAAGLPVIATAKAVEGLALEPDRHFIAAEKPVDFVAALTRLAADDGLRQRLIGAGRQLVHKRHTQKAIQEAVADALADLDAETDHCDCDGPAFVGRK